MGQYRRVPTQVGFAASQEELDALGGPEKVIRDFEFEIAAAIIRFGNTGVDPAFIGTVLHEAGKGVTTAGYAAMLDAMKEHPRRTELPPLHPRFAKMGGNPQGGLERLMEGLSAVMNRGHIEEGGIASGRLERVAFAGTDDAKRLLEEFMSGGRTPKPDEVN